jgi:uncharacterized lipoprotein YddW (UPF0748 family)
MTRVENMVEQAHARDFSVIKFFWLGRRGNRTARRLSVAKK